MSWVYVHDIAFPISQPGNCSASFLLSRPAPRNRQESHPVTMLFTQLLLNAGSLKVEHQHTLITHSHANNLREIEGTHRHSNQWGITNPSPRASGCRSRRQHGGQGSLQSLARKDLWSQEGSRAGEVPSPAGQILQWPMPREINVVWSSTLV